MVFQEAQQWGEAERHYREAARINEQQGNLVGAAQTCIQLANVNQLTGKLAAAELWYRKAMEGFKAVGDKVNLSVCLSNLADLLQNLPGRLAEARQLAEEALAVKQTLNPDAAMIWKTYNILAGIAEQEAATTAEDHLKAERQAQARDYHRRARDAKRNFPGARHALRRHAVLITATVAACAGHQEAGEFVANSQAAMRQSVPNVAKLAAVLDRVVAGERDEDALCENLGPDSAMIVEAILHGLADPATLDDLFPEQGRE